MHSSSSTRKRRCSKTASRNSTMPGTSLSHIRATCSTIIGILPPHDLQGNCRRTPQGIQSVREPRLHHLCALLLLSPVLSTSLTPLRVVIGFGRCRAGRLRPCLSENSASSGSRISGSRILTRVLFCIDVLSDLLYSILATIYPSLY